MKDHQIMNPRFVNAIDDAYFNEASAASLAWPWAVRFHRCLTGVCDFVQAIDHIDIGLLGYFRPGFAW